MDIVIMLLIAILILVCIGVYGIVDNQETIFRKLKQLEKIIRKEIL